MRHVAAHRLADAATGKLSGAARARVMAHVDGCVACSEALARVNAARQGFAELLRTTPTEPTPAAAARAEASIRWARLARPSSRAPSLRWTMALAGTAVAGVIAIWATADWSRAPGDRRAPQPIAHQLRPLPSPAPSSMEALVTLVGGDVKLARSETSSRRLDLDAHLGAGDRLSSAPGARVAAQWSEGSGFLLYGNAQLVLSRLEPRTQRLALDHGKVSVRVGPHEPGESLHVLTPDHVVSVHGTWFTVASEAHTTTVEVLEGTVEVTDRDGSSSTMLHAPARAVFGRGHTASSPLSGHEAARLRAESELNLMAWPGLAAARAASGRLQVSSQPASELTVDGVEVGPTPLALRSTLGRHYVELTRAGFEPLRRWVSVAPESGELRLGMVKQPPPPPDTAPVEIESMVRRRATQIRACYERRLKRDPSLAGTVSLRLRVGEAGQVTRVTVEESTLPDPLVGECLRREAAGWSFAQGRNATVVYPFVFRTQ
jgi:hypothetical protein